MRETKLTNMLLLQAPRETKLKEPAATACHEMQKHQLLWFNLPNKIPLSSKRNGGQILVVLFIALSVQE